MQGRIWNRIIDPPICAVNQDAQARDRIDESNPVTPTDFAFSSVSKDKQVCTFYATWNNMHPPERQLSDTHHVVR